MSKRKSIAVARPTTGAPRQTRESYAEEIASLVAGEVDALMLTFPHGVQIRAKAEPHFNSEAASAKRAIQADARAVGRTARVVDAVRESSREGGEGTPDGMTLTYWLTPVKAAVRRPGTTVAAVPDEAPVDDLDLLDEADPVVDLPVAAVPVQSDDDEDDGDYDDIVYGTDN